MASSEDYLDSLLKSMGVPTSFEEPQGEETAEPEAEAVPEAEEVPQPEAEEVPQPEAEEVPQAEPEAEAVPEAEEVPQAEPEAEAVPQPEAEEVPQAEPEIEEISLPDETPVFGGFEIPEDIIVPSDVEIPDDIYAAFPETEDLADFAVPEDIIPPEENVFPERTSIPEETKVLDEFAAPEEAPVPDAPSVPEEPQIPEEPVPEAFAPEIPHQDEIPVMELPEGDPRGSKLVIDSAPSLEPAPEEPIENDIADLMASLMPSMQEMAEPADEAPLSAEGSFAVPDESAMPDEAAAQGSASMPEESVVSEEAAAPEEAPVALDDSVNLDALLASALGSLETPQNRDSVEVEMTGDPQADYMAAMRMLQDAPDPAMDVPEDGPSDIPMDFPAEAFTDLSADELADFPAEEFGSLPEEAPAERPAEDGMPSMADFDLGGIAAELAAEETADPARESVSEPPVEEVAASSAEEFADFPADEFADFPAEEFGSLPEEAPAEMPAEDGMPSMADFDLGGIAAELAAEETADPAKESVSEPPVEEVVVSSAEEFADFPADEFADFPAEEFGSLPEEAPAEMPAEDGMPSMADFDLGGIAAELAAMEAEEPAEEASDTLGQDDIEALLAQAAASASEPDASAPEELSLNDLLENDADAASGDIEELLEKSDRNEAVDEGIEALLSGGEELPLPSLDDGAPKTRAEKAAERKRLREEKKEARRLAKEEKARKKAAEKAGDGLVLEGTDSGRKPKKRSGKAAQRIPVEAEGQDFRSAELSDADVSELDLLLAGADQAASLGSAVNTEDSGSDSLLFADDITAEEAPSDLLKSGPEAHGGEDDFGDSDALAGLLGSEFPDSEEEEANPEDLLPDIGDRMPAEDGEEPEKAPGKKKGFFARLLEAFSEEVDDEEDEASELKNLSDENAGILEELDAEGETGGKKKKKKKDKKAAKNASPEDEEGGGAKKKKGKEKKPKKEKKEKKEKEPKEIPVGTGKRLDPKKVIIIAAACASIGVVLFLVTTFASNYTVKKAGRDAYYAGDYQTCYEDLYGKDLDETETIMFNRSECILRIRLWLREYEILSSESDLRALDSLIQSVSSYPSLYESAVYWNCAGEVSEVYAQIIGVLGERYGLTPEQAMVIASDPDDVSYTRKVTAIAAGGAYGSWESGGGGAGSGEQTQNGAPETLPEQLPEESDPGSTTTFVTP